MSDFRDTRGVTGWLMGMALEIPQQQAIPGHWLVTVRCVSYGNTKAAPACTRASGSQTAGLAGRAVHSHNGTSVTPASLWKFAFHLTREIRKKICRGGTDVCLLCCCFLVSLPRAFFTVGSLYLKSTPVQYMSSHLTTSKNTGKAGLLV